MRLQHWVVSKIGQLPSLEVALKDASHVHIQEGLSLSIDLTENRVGDVLANAWKCLDSLPILGQATSPLGEDFRQLD